MLEAFDAVIKENPESEEFPKIPDDLFDDEEDVALHPPKPDMHAFEADDYTLEELDEYLTTSIIILQGGQSLWAKVIR